MTRTLSLLLFATACAAFGAVVEAPVEVVERHPDNVPLDELLASLQALSPLKRAELADTMGVLLVNCPYTRAVVQLPIASKLVVSKIDATQIDATKRDDWRALQRTLQAHVEVLDVIGVDMHLPGPGDHLYRSAEGSMVERATLELLADPIAPTLRLIEQNDDLVNAMDEDTKDLLRHHNDVAYALMGPTTMYYQNGQWQQALRRLAPFVTDPQSKSAVAAIITALDLHDQHGC